jgi:hypothetical protein
MRLTYIVATLLTCCGLLTGCGMGTGQTPPSSAATPTAKVIPRPSINAPVVLGDGRTPDLPAIQAEQERRRASLQVAPYILLHDGLEPRLDAAQRAVADDVRHQRYTRTNDGRRLLTEVMHVATPRPGDLPPAIVAQCPPETCLRVTLYVYPSNTTLTATVDRRLQVIDLQAIEGAQPEIPAHLAALATEVAVASPLTHEELGVPPQAAMTLDYASATKTNYVGTTCERSNHLCVSPVFSWGDQALWTIVDLTDLRLVAATWTEQGATAQRRAVSEATLQDAALAPLCETPGRIERDGWSAEYLLTSSDGLELRNISYQGRPVLTSVKQVDWHVGYPGSDGTRVGFSDAVGCPVFSAAAIIPYGPPELREGPGDGFTLAITFRSPNWPQPCAYQYTFTAGFSPDGSLALSAGNEGRGCGLEGVYHPVWRVEPATPAALRLWDGTQATPLSSEGMAEWPAASPHSFQLDGPGGPLTITPAWGDAELAYLYWTLAKAEEGQGDLASIGSCCNLDARQGPEQFVNDEPLAERPVLWYVPRITNAERERCWADMELQDGLLRPVIWPCEAGLTIHPGNR